MAGTTDLGIQYPTPGDSTPTASWWQALASTTDAALTTVKTAADAAEATANTFAGAVGIVMGPTATGAELNSALVFAATAGVPLTLSPATTLTTTVQINIPSGTRLNGNGGTIRNAIASGAAMMLVNGRTNVLLENFTIDGDKAAYAPATEWRHGISIINSSHVELRRVKSNQNKGDGFYIGDQTSGAASDVTMYSVVADGNYRQGLSISHASRVHVYGSLFMNTAGTAPEAGVDIEPNIGSVVCQDITFTDCVFSGNAAYGFLVVMVSGATVAQRGVHLVNCVSHSNLAGGVRLVNCENIRWTGGAIRDNDGPGINQNATVLAKDVEFANVTITRNGTHGAVWSGPFDGVAFTSCTVANNARLSTGDGLLFSPTVASTDVRLTANSLVAGRYGVNINANVLDVALIGNTYKSQTTAQRLLSTSAPSIASRIDLDVLPRPAVTGAKGGNAALTSLIAQLVARGIVADSTT